MPRRHHPVEPVDADEETRREWTRNIAGSDLSIG